MDELITDEDVVDGRTDVKGRCIQKFSSCI